MIFVATLMRTLTRGQQQMCGGGLLCCQCVTLHPVINTFNTCVEAELRPSASCYHHNLQCNVNVPSRIPSGVLLLILEAKVSLLIVLGDADVGLYLYFASFLPMTNFRLHKSINKSSYKNTSPIIIM